jgi:putative flippase GtrA
MSHHTVSNPVCTGLDVAVTALSRTGVSENFIRFAVVGTLGFCWDTGTVYALRGLTGLYIAGTFGFLVAATVNWAINRLWTFRDRAHASPHVQWAKFLVANSVGFVFNRGTFFVLISINLLSRNHPILPIIAGSIAGLCFNYFLSKRFVFG